jgi:FkbM family methyltransferase
MNLLDHLRLRLDAFILHRVPFRSALRRDLARYFITDERAYADLMDSGRQQPGDVHLRAFDAALARHGGQLSFSQSGEDLIVAHLFRELRVAQPTYLDLGAFDPWEFSNTARLHLRGSHGINVEPNPAQFGRFLQSRPDDRNVNVGIASAAGTLTYFELDAPTLNTFSREEAERCVCEEGHRILRQTPVPVRTLPDVLAHECNGRFPDFLSVDIEGLDRLVVEVIAAQAVKPKVVCIETISYSRSGQGQKDEALIEAMRACGYMCYADTNINTIFVLERLWGKALEGAGEKQPASGTP